MQPRAERAELIGEEQVTDIDQEKAADERNDAQVGPRPAQRAGHGFEQQAGEQEGDAQAQGIGGEHDDAAGD